MIEVANYKFKILERIGNGGFGYVERIELFNLRGTYSGFYARKVLDQQMELKMYRERFEREVLSQCVCAHENIVHIYIHSLEGEHPYFIMELADCDLRNVIESGLESDDEKLKIMKMICYGVRHIHELGYLHRDIKPNNILKFGSVYKVSDFGLIRKAIQNEDSSPLTSIGLRLGTDTYIAPELMYSGSDYTVKSDIFAMGRVFEQLNFKDQSLIDIVSKCSALDQKHRYSTVDEILSDICTVTALEVTCNA